eukprot:850958-Rhodomonas_salina.1
MFFLRMLLQALYQYNSSFWEYERGKVPCMASVQRHTRGNYSTKRRGRGHRTPRTPNHSLAAPPLLRCKNEGSVETLVVADPKSAPAAPGASCYWAKEASNTIVSIICWMESQQFWQRKTSPQQTKSRDGSSFDVFSSKHSLSPASRQAFPAVGSVVEREG